jgi:hypothetical protein
MAGPGLAPVPAPQLPGEWSFWADMIRGGQSLGPVAVSGFGYTERLSAFGHGTVSVTLPCGIEPARLLRLWTWRLWCFYDGALVWCGVPSGIIDEGSVRVSLTLTELTGYLLKRAVDYFPPWEPRGMEQTAIAANIASPLADVGVRVVTSPGPVPVLRDRTYQYLEGGSRGELLTNLAGVIDGPEFRADYAMTADGPECVLRIAYPRVGTGEADLGVTVPGSALGFRAQWDADQLRTRTYAVGDLRDDAPPEAVRPVQVVDVPSDDLPRLDAVDDWPGTVEPAALRDRAQTASVRQAAPALQLSASPSEAWPDLSAYRVGDDVTVRATTPLLPGGLDATGRLVELSVSAGEARATWTVATSMPPPVPRETLSGRLDRLDTTTASVFRAGRKTAPPAQEAP